MIQQKEIQEYFNQKKDLHKVLLDFIDNEDNGDHMQQLFDIIKIQKICESHDEIKVFLQIISKISKNHHQIPVFYNKIEKILSRYANEIKEHLTSTEIFHIFKNNKKILLFLLEQKFIKIDDHVNEILKMDKKKYPHYFFPEVESFIEQSEREKIKKELENIEPENFNDFRQKGENETYICSLIRSDSIDDFISHVAKNNISFSSSITKSIFETNPFLLTRIDTTLIEYAAFFGSIRIFQYLLLNKAKLNQSIWYYAIHGKDSEIIQVLVDKLGKPEKIEYLRESIKCHHNDIAIYIQDNYLTKENDQSFQNSCEYFCFRYFNFDFMPENIAANRFIFHYLCHFGYTNLVKLLIQSKNVDFNIEVMYNDEILIFFLFITSHHFVWLLITII